MNSDTSDVLAGMQTAIAQIETMRQYRSEIKTDGEFPTPTVCEKETQSEETVKQSSKRCIY